MREVGKGELWLSPSGQDQRGEQQGRGGVREGEEGAWAECGGEEGECVGGGLRA